MHSGYPHGTNPWFEFFGIRHEKMADIDNMRMLEVSSAEAGQKLMQFLLRRLSLPQPLLHRWIRTGQIRVNGGRAKPFDRVVVGDSVRLPPFAMSMGAMAQAGDNKREGDASQAGSIVTVTVLPLPPLVHEDKELLVFNKPAGLPVHTGTGHEDDSLATRLATQYITAPFQPTPAHRLDKDTSGLLLVAASYGMLRTLQDALRESELVKEYLAWVEGVWAPSAPLRLEHQLAKRYTGSDEKVHVGKGKNAVCMVACVRRDAIRNRSLLHVRLLTGRTHQIRAQMAEEGHPLCGDVKYGGQGGEPLRLHALRLILPDGREFVVSPPWDGADAVASLPPPLLLD